MEKQKNGFSTTGYFSLGDEGEIDTEKFFKDSSELAKFIDKINDKYDDHHSNKFTGKIYRYLRIFKRVNSSKHGRGANESNIFVLFWKMMVKTFVYQLETDAFSKIITIFSRKTLAWSISNSYHQIKEDLML